MFVCSLFSTQILVKLLAGQTCRFAFPALVTSLHFLTVWGITVLYWLRVGSPQQLSPASLGSVDRYVSFVLPIAFALPLSVVFSNQALVYMGAGLTGIIGTLAPLTTAVLQHLFGRRISMRGWAGIFIAGTGATVIGFGELKVNRQASENLMRGIAFAMAAVLLRSCKAVMQDKLLAPNAYVCKRPTSSVLPLANPPCGPLALHPMRMWALQGPPCLLISVVYMLSVEDLHSSWQCTTPMAVGLMALSCVSASVLNILGMFTLKELGASSFQIIGKLNTIMTVAFSVTYFGEVLPLPVIYGTCLVLLGITILESATRSPQKAAKVATMKPLSS